MNRSLLAASAFVLLAACSKPKAPVLTPKETRVTTIDPRGVTFLATIDAYNPNGFALSARSLTARVVLDGPSGAVDLGSVSAPKGIAIPAGGHAEITAPLELQWKGAASVAQLAATGQNIPYKVTGTVNVGGEDLNLDVPFTVSGTITRDQILGAALKGLPQIPGLQLPH